MGKTLQNNMRRLRFEHQEMTQQELADKIGVTRQTVNAIELGKYSPSLEVAFQIAVVFASVVLGARAVEAQGKSLTGIWTLKIERIGLQLELTQKNTTIRGTL